jgi:hypothetical protein
MKYLILNIDYPAFLDWFYAAHPGLKSRGYDDQMRERSASLFGVADFYSGNLRKLGHDARDIHANNEYMQKVWAREQGFKTGGDYRWHVQLRKNAFPFFCRSKDGDWYYKILAEQIKRFKPDVLLNQAMDKISGRFLKEMKPYVRLSIGQIASSLPEDEDFGCYDLIISSLPNLIEYFRNTGIHAELHRFGFEPKILDSLTGRKEKVPISFVGNLFSGHKSRIVLLEHLSGRLDVRIWSGALGHLSETSLLRARHEGAAWGVDMYNILFNSKITLNSHIDMAGPFANNMRLYEATGAGALLVTDWKANLHEMFEPGKEVVAFRTPEECAQIILHYLDHEEERESIARAGQRRTLGEHTYYRRMQELTDIVKKYL